MPLQYPYLIPPEHAVQDLENIQLLSVTSHPHHRLDSSLTPSDAERATRTRGTNPA
jgi:hypothetical protein